MKKIINIIIIFLLICASVFVVFFTRIPCLFNKITGFYCPACGVARMFRSLIELEIYQAFRYNPLVFILLIIVFGYGLICIINKKIIKIENKYLLMLVTIIIMFWFLRNIPFFSFLAPTKL